METRFLQRHDRFGFQQTFQVKAGGGPPAVIAYNNDGSAAGGMGGLLVQWAKHLAANVIGTVSTEVKARTGARPALTTSSSTRSRISWLKSSGSRTGRAQI
jgi:hypothetical protein